MPRPDESRRRTILGIGIVAIIISAFTYHFWPGESDSSPLPRALAVIVEDLEHDSAHRREAAREDAWTLLADPIRATLGIRISRVGRVIPAEWFRKSGHPLITDALLRHFSEGWEEDEAHALLAALIELYPNAGRRVAIVPLRGSLDPTIADTPIDGIAIAREIARATPLGCYFCYRLDVTETPIRTLIAAALLTALREPAVATVRDRWIRLLRRVPDHDLRTIALHNRGPERWLDPAWKQLARDRGLGYRDMDDWCESGDHDSTRRSLIETSIGSADPETRARGLDRFRWDPVSDLDAQILQLATTGDADTRRLAIRALPGIPNTLGGEIIAAAIDDPLFRESALNAARALTGASFGFRDGSWDVGLTPVAHFDVLDRWRDLIGRVAPVSLSAASTDPSESEFLAYVQLLAPRVRRGDLTATVAKRAIPSLAARGLALSSPPGIRAATWSTVTRWERPPVDVLVTEILREKDPTIRSALLDALLHSGRDGIQVAITTAIDAIAESQRFDGIELTRGYSIAYPTVRLFETLLPALESTESRQRAAAAYLAGGLTVPKADERRGKLLALVDTLHDKAEGPRYWAHASLRTLFGDEFGYDARQSTEANDEPIRQWRARIIRGDRNP